MDNEQDVLRMQIRSKDVCAGALAKSVPAGWIIVIGDIVAVIVTGLGQ